MMNRRTFFKRVGQAIGIAVMVPVAALAIEPKFERLVFLYDGRLNLPVQFNDLRSGDMFRIMDTGPNPVEDGNELFTAISDAKDGCIRVERG
jgi:hypothetical protein